MSKEKENESSRHTRKQRMLMAVTVVISAIIMRLVPHIPNFAPLTAGALFGAAYLPKRYALTIPLAAVAISDYLLLYINPFAPQIFNFSQIQPISALVHGTTPWVWGSFMISGLLGLTLRNKRSTLKVGGVTLLASLQFFLITNFGVWAAGAYGPGIAGLIASYVAGLPFFRWTILGDLFYTASFFGLYELAVKQTEQPEQETIPSHSTACCAAHSC